MNAPAAAGPDNRRAMYRFFEILRTGSFERLEEVLHEDYVADTPQSGERVRGIENQRAIFRNYPGGLDRGGITADEVHIVGPERRFIMTPTFHVVEVQGSGDTLTVYSKARYPDGSDWYVVTLAAFRDGKIARTTQFFAPSFAPPAWRAQWVERMD